MDFVLKLLAANVVIVTCAQIGRRSPALGGLIATMPLTTLIVMLWLYSDKPGDPGLMVSYTRGVLWGIFPSLAFYAVASVCLRKGLPFPLVLLASFGVWLLGAFLHHRLIG
jgi:F0F1-type ATP synthase assembly protein I